MKQSTVILGIVGILIVAGIGFFVINNQNSNPKQSMSKESSPTAVTEQKAMNNKTIVETAVESSNFTTLVAAVKAAGLAETLSGTGPFTVFAPTDEAFAKLPAGTVESLLKDKEKLKTILTYHVVSGKVMAADVVKLNTATTVQGQDVTIKVEDGKVMVDNANVVTTDIEASNGVIHVIDTVLMPK